MTTKPIDFFMRRTGAVLFEWKEAVIPYMADSLRWSGEDKMKYAAELEAALIDAAVPVDQQKQTITKNA